MHAVRAFWLPLLLATLVAAYFGGLLAKRGRTLQALQAERQTLQARIARLDRENAALRAERDALLGSPQAIERVAREEYGFRAPGEVVSDFPAAGLESGLASAPVTAQSPQAFAGWDAVPVVLPAVVFVGTALVLAIWNAGGRSIGDGRDGNA
jgi:cell division protein FtsB